MLIQFTEVVYVNKCIIILNGGDLHNNKILFVSYEIICFQRREQKEEGDGVSVLTLEKFVTMKFYKFNITCNTIDHLLEFLGSIFKSVLPSSMQNQLGNNENEGRIFLRSFLKISNVLCLKPTYYMMTVIYSRQLTNFH